MSDPKPILVLGATGKQGKGLINVLLSSPAKDSFTILALTRTTTSASAKALAAKSPTIKLVQGNVDDPPAVFAAALAATNGKPIFGVFTVLQAVIDGATQEREEERGRGMIDASIANHVQHYVYSSVDRGANTETDPTYVPHFASKFHIEEYLKKQTQNGEKMPYTILRPVAFMDGLTYDFMGKIFATMTKIALGPSAKPLQYISCTDIGVFAAKAFQNPQDPVFKNKGISLAAEGLTFAQIDAAFKERLGYPVPTTFEFLAMFIKWMVKELNIMFRWFDEVGFVVDTQEVRKVHPGLMGFGDWLERESGFPKNKKGQ